MTAVGGDPGLLTREAPVGGSVTYRFTASHPGTYLYHSGTRPDLQIEMGLVGALIVRPLAGVGRAYSDPATSFDHEYLFLLTEMDPRIHQLMELGAIEDPPLTDFLSDYFPVYWFALSCWEFCSV